MSDITGGGVLDVSALIRESLQEIYPDGPGANTQPSTKAKTGPSRETPNRRSGEDDPEDAAPETESDTEEDGSVEPGESEEQAADDTEDQAGDNEDEDQPEESGESDSAPLPKAVSEQIKRLKHESAMLKELKEVLGVNSKSEVVEAVKTKLAEAGGSEIVLNIPDNPAAGFTTPKKLEEFEGRVQQELASIRKWFKAARAGDDLPALDGRDSSEWTEERVERYEQQLEGLRDKLIPQQRKWIARHGDALTQLAAGYDVVQKTHPLYAEADAYVADYLKENPGVAADPRYLQVVVNDFIMQQVAKGKVVISQGKEGRLKVVPVGKSPAASAAKTTKPEPPVRGEASAPPARKVASGSARAEAAFERGDMLAFIKETLVQQTR